MTYDSNGYTVRAERVVNQLLSATAEQRRAAREDAAAAASAEQACSASAAAVLAGLRARQQKPKGFFGRLFH